MRALGLIGPMPHLISKYTWNTHLFSECAWQVHIRPRQSFFAYSALNINFKGVHMKLKIVGSPCNFNGKAYFYDFFYVSQFNY